MTGSQIITTEYLQQKILNIRGQQVMLDKDLAELYGVKPIRLREQVRRNLNKFPTDFMFELTNAEVVSMVSQNAIPSKQHLGGSLPLVYTEQGVSMLATDIKMILCANKYVTMANSPCLCWNAGRRYLSEAWKPGKNSA